MKKIFANKVIFFIPLLIIMIISFFSMYYVKNLNTLYNNNLYKQIIWYILGVGIIFLFKKINSKIFFKYAWVFYLVSIGLLIYVLIFGKVVNGARAWINIKGISFQPSEFMKFSLALLLSNMANNFKSNGYLSEFIYILKVVFITVIPSILVFLEPDTGAIVFFLIEDIVILFFSDIKKIWFLFLIMGLLILGSSFVLLYIYNRDLLISLVGTSIFYRVDRLVTFKTMGIYQLENALIGIGASNFLNIDNKGLIYIPEAPTDFVFAFLISAFGFFAGYLVLFCYLLMDIYLLVKVCNMKKNTMRYFLISFTSIFIFNQIINIGMNLGLLPIIGIPLPFLSYGGSVLVIYFLFIGIIFSSDNYINSNKL